MTRSSRSLATPFAIVYLLFLSTPAARGGDDCDIDPKEFEATYELPDATVARGGTVTLPLSVVANANVNGLAFSVDFDEEVLECTGVDGLYELPSGADYAFFTVHIDNENATPGSGGVDEGTVIAALVISFFDPSDEIPADTETEVMGLGFRSLPESTASSTEIDFVNGALDDNGVGVENVITVCGFAVEPEAGASYTFIGSQLGVLDEVTVFIRGDANANQRVEMNDAVRTLNYLFRGAEEPPCLDAADADDNGVLNIGDPVRTLYHLFRDGSALPVPFPDVGIDPTPDGLDCVGGATS